MSEPALGSRGGPAAWRRAVEGARVAGFRPNFEDAGWSFLFRGTRYARTAGKTHTTPPDRAVQISGPMLNPPVWTWEVPLYFWFGGIASGASFVALAADVAGDRRSARVARRLALGAIAPAAPLLIADLGRPERFLNMLRIFKLRSPMSMGAWCLAAFSNLIGGAVLADAVGHRRAARRLGTGAAVAGTYLGSYTGVLLASTAVPVWSRSRLLLGPIFVSTATLNGAAAVRLLLPAGPARTALAAVETGAVLGEIVLSEVNQRQLGSLRAAIEEGRHWRLFAAAKASMAAGLALRLARRRGDLPSALFLAGGLLFRYAWVEAGKHSARDDEAVAALARSRSVQ